MAGSHDEASYGPIIKQASRKEVRRIASSSISHFPNKKNALFLCFSIMLLSGASNLMLGDLNQWIKTDSPSGKLNEAQLLSNNTFLKNLREAKDTTTEQETEPVSQLVASHFSSSSPHNNNNNNNNHTGGVVGDSVHVVSSRFMQTQHKLVELGLARAELFRTFCLPSMIHQTNQNFLWIVSTDPLLNDTLKSFMIEILKPYPHFLLIANNNHFTPRFRSPEMYNFSFDPTNIISGNATLLQNYHEASHTKTVIETRIDADDALHSEFIDMIQSTAHQVLPSPTNDTEMEQQQLQPKWLLWCAKEHNMEWHMGNESRPEGMLIKKSESHCITPGLTRAYTVGMHTSQIPWGNHMKIHIKAKACKGDQVYEGANCLTIVNDRPSALRARTVTSAGMAGVGEVKTSQALQTELWNVAKHSFAINRKDAIHTKTYLKDHEGVIALENLIGQCTHGHSCKDKARTALLNIIKNNQVDLTTTRPSGEP